MTQNQVLSLAERFLKYKQSILPQTFGAQWERDKHNFDIEFKNGEFINKGKWNFFPEIYNDTIDKAELIILDQNEKDSNKKYYINIGEKKLCLKAQQGNKTLIYVINYYNLIRKFINEKNVVCEVGSGSGLLSAMVNYNKNTTNIMIDIPEVMLAGISLCATLFPGKKFLLPNEIKNRFNIRDYDFIFMSPEQINLIDRETVDFGINTQSFMEMDFEEVDKYLNFFNYVTKNKGYFFCSNRLRKRHYFYNYNFQILKFFKKILFEKDGYFYSKKNLASMLNIILQKDLVEKNQFRFYLKDKILGIFKFKLREFFFWLKKDIKNFIKFRKTKDFYKNY